MTWNEITDEADLLLYYEERVGEVAPGGICYLPLAPHDMLAFAHPQTGLLHRAFRSRPKSLTQVILVPCMDGPQTARLFFSLDARPPGGSFCAALRATARTTAELDVANAATDLSNALASLLKKSAGVPAKRRGAAYRKAEQLALGF